jgi:hypothetical protein
MPIILTLCLGLMLPAFSAGLEKINIKGLNLDYTLPYGKGEVEKLQLGLSKGFAGPYPLEISRHSSSLSLTSPFLDISWIHPLEFFHDLQLLKTRKLTAHVEKNNHDVKAEHFSFQPAKQGSYAFEKLSVECKGLSIQQELKDRLLDDCLASLNMSIDKLEVPLDFFLTDILADLPDMPEEETSEDLGLVISEGNYYLKTRVRYYIKAYIRSWGEVKLSNDRQLMAIRIDKVKYGYLPITHLVWKALRTRINHPRVEISPPWIKIKLEE